MNAIRRCPMKQLLQLILPRICDLFKKTLPRPRLPQDLRNPGRRHPRPLCDLIIRLPQRLKQYHNAMLRILVKDCKIRVFGIIKRFRIGGVVIRDGRPRKRGIIEVLLMAEGVVHDTTGSEEVAPSQTSEGCFSSTTPLRGRCGGGSIGLNGLRPFNGCASRIARMFGLVHSSDPSAFEANFSITTCLYHSKSAKA